MNVVQIIIVTALCATTAFLSHMGMAVFHDGIRPVIPEFLEGRMKRPELASIAFGLSIGFIASVGIAYTLPTGILNPWLLFLTTDILGLMAPKKWIAPILGGAWGALTLVSLSGINAVLTGLPVDMIGAMGTLSEPVVSGFALFPLVAIFMQFGSKKGAIATAVTFLVRQIMPMFTTIGADSWQILTGIILLVGFAITNDIKNKTDTDMSENIFSERTSRIRKNVFFLMAGGALIALACNVGILAGSDVSIFTLADAAKQTDPAMAKALVNQAAIAEFMRALGFIPLIVTTAVTTGVYGVAGLTFVYAAGYIMPNPLFAAVAGAVIIFVEVMLLGVIGKFLGRFPSMRDASDNIRSSMTLVMEFALLIGSINACITMGGYTGFFIGGMVYFANEMTGRKIMRMAIGPIAAIVTGIVLNLMSLVGLFAI